MTTWLEKVAAAGMAAAANQFTGMNGVTKVRGMPAPTAPRSMGTMPGPGPVLGAGSRPGRGAMGGPIKDLTQNTTATLGQETITHGDHQNKVNTAPIVPGMVHPAHPST